jgi:DNA mismatch repair protein MSH6
MIVSYAESSDEEDEDVFAAMNAKRSRGRNRRVSAMLDDDEDGYNDDDGAAEEEDGENCLACICLLWTDHRR